MVKTVLVDGVKVDAAAMLVALHDNTRAIGLGVLHDLRRGLTREEASKVLADMDRFRFDYFAGRPLKTCADSNGDIGNSRMSYDRDAGRGAFDDAVAEAKLVPVSE